MDSDKKLESFNNADNNIYEIFSSVINNFSPPKNVTDCIYPFSNENIYEGIRDLNLQGKSVCTVGSSGDQVLNALFLGADDITLIDGNPLAQYYTELKIASIKGLAFHDCLDYFTSENLLNYKYYSKISHYLSNESKYFWDSIILETNDENHHDIIKQFVFHTSNDDVITRKVLTDIGRNLQPFFNNPEDYYTLKHILLNENYQIKYKTGMFIDFDKILGDGKFDLIMLSNIYDYTYQDNFPNIVNTLIKNHLNQNGTIQLTYLFTATEDTSLGRLLFLTSLKGKFPNLTIYEKVMPGYFKIPDAHVFGKYDCME